MTIEQIKDKLGIDITSKNRTKIYVYLRLLYLKKEKEKRSVLSISQSLNYNHASLFHTLKKESTYEQDELYWLIVKAFVTEDKKYIKEYNDHFIKKVRIKKEAIDKGVIISKEKTRKKYPLFVVAEKLRSKTTYLNNKNFNEWNNYDWENYNKITG